MTWGGSGPFLFDGAAVEVGFLPIESVSGTAYVLVCDSGSYSVSGQQINFYANRVLVPDAGSYTISGKTAELSIARKLIAEAGAYIINGQEAILDFVSAVTDVIDYVITFRRRRR